MGDFFSQTVFLVGLPFEKRALRFGQCGASCEVVGPGALDGEIFLDRAQKRGVTRVVSCGLAGGLPHPDWRKDRTRVVMPRSVLFRDKGHWQTFHPEPLPGVGGEVLTFPLVGVDAPVTTVDERLELHAQTGAGAVDMESHRLGRGAMARGLSFGVLRAIADGPEVSLPPAVLNSMGEGGEIRILPLMKGLLSGAVSPAFLVRLALNTHLALRDLRKALSHMTEQDP